MPTTVTSDLQARAYAVLLDIVSDGSLKAGRALDVGLLADRTGLPPTSIDQALERLLAHGFVERGEAHRYHVARCSREEARRVFVRQGDGDSAAASMTVHGLDPDRRVIGLAILAQGREALATGSQARLAEADLAFHRYLADSVAAPELGVLDVEHWTRFRRVVTEWWACASPIQGDRAWQEHAAIVEALTHGDGGEAERLIRRHVLSSVEVVARFPTT